VPAIQDRRNSGAVNVMDKPNIAFALMTIILAVYISVALLLSRVRRSHAGKRGRHRPQVRG
jgi:hypothetical protein